MVRDKHAKAIVSYSCSVVARDMHCMSSNSSGALCRLHTSTLCDHAKCSAFGSKDSPLDRHGDECVLEGL